MNEKNLLNQLKETQFFSEFHERMSQHWAQDKVSVSDDDLIALLAVRAIACDISFEDMLRIDLCSLTIKFKEDRTLDTVEHQLTWAVAAFRAAIRARMQPIDEEFEDESDVKMQ